MRLSFLFGPTSAGRRPLDFARIDDDPRGLTGTDGSFVYLARAMAERGHIVDIYAHGSAPCRWGKIEVRGYEDRIRHLGATGYDAVCAWNDVVGLCDMSPRSVRLLNMQLNNFEYVQDDSLNLVDVFTAPSAVLANRLAQDKTHPGHEPWRVLPNGCDLNDYDLTKKVPGRCIYASSPDRGLHVVCEEWPRIKEAVPHASLRIFYHSLPEMLTHIPYLTHPQAIPWDQEKGRRAIIMRDALPALEALDVKFVGPVSRRQMAQEYSEAQVLAYPCVTIDFTEGFGTAVLEGCAAGAVPVITDADAFGTVYRGACPMVPGQPRFEFANHAWQAEWRETVIRMLRDPAERAKWVDAGRALAGRYTWARLAERLESILVDAGREKRAA